MKKTIGIILLSIPFGAMFYIVVSTLGFWGAMGVLGISFTGTAVITVGVFLLTEQ